MRPSKDNNNIRELKQAGMLTRLIYIMMKKGPSNFIIKEVQKTWLCYNSDYIHPFKKYVTLTIIKGIKKSIVNNYL